MSLYGLKQANRNWGEDLDQSLRDFGLTPSSADPCLYIMVDSSGRLVVLIYVDDFIITGNSKVLIAKFRQHISSIYKMKDLGVLRWILGMEVKRDRANRIMEVSQAEYVKKQILDKYGMSECKPVSTPMVDILRKTSDSQPDPFYMKIVGSLLYAAVVTRPDILYAVCSLGRHMSASSDEHMMAAKRVMRYLQGTKDLTLKYSATDVHGTEVKGFCDADWAGDPDSRRSTSGWVFMLAGAAVSWGSKLQSSVALSSAEAEYVAACAATQEAMHLRRLLGDLGYEQLEPTVIMEDNQACIAVSQNPALHKRMKHVDICYHYVRERVHAKDIVLQYIPTEHQVADLFTKPLGKQRLMTLRDCVMGHIAQ